MRYPLLLSSAQLKTLLASSQPCLIFDCSFDLGDPGAGAAQFAAQHIAGARHADLARDLSAPHGHGPSAQGRHPLPERADFARWLGAEGLTADTQVVVYDRQRMNFCGRLWWMLKWCGHEAVAVLDGGLPAWLAAGGAVASGPAAARAPNAQHGAPPFEPGPARALLRQTHEVAAALHAPGQTLIDARAPARYRGDVEPLDPVAGHIPGARNRPFASNLDPDGRFWPAARLRAEFEALLAGRDPASVVHHCGSGVSAIPNLLAMEIAGLGRSALYAGSWSAWCNTPGLPCVQGDPDPDPA